MYFSYSVFNMILYAYYFIIIIIHKIGILLLFTNGEIKNIDVKLLVQGYITVELENCMIFLT